ncbi:hypothetical protein KIN20_019682 [Parelaphostrongylus tenuis]|uniref:Uncharacterized protein n=1 Tax=Parelaphostrongylus tenuis TaxID=148309 RepID=A0AAD5MPV0_PARTN|nr:hypothetical protein KIN20_019682 [Parelaphostrongylus tenuis]
MPSPVSSVIPLIVERFEYASLKLLFFPLIACKSGLVGCFSCRESLSIIFSLKVLVNKIDHLFGAPSCAFDIARSPVASSSRPFIVVEMYYVFSLLDLYHMISICNILPWQPPALFTIQLTS